MKRIGLFIIFIFLLLPSIGRADNTVYSVQVSATVSYEGALAYYSPLKNHQNVRIEMTNNNYYAVRLGAFPQRDDALPLLQQMRQIHPDAFIVRSNIDKSQIKNASNLNYKETAAAKAPPPPPAPAGKGKETVKPLAPSSTVRKPEGSGTRAAAVPSPPPQEPKRTGTAAIVPTPPLLQNPEDYFRRGMQAYQARLYEQAIAFLSQYLSMAPRGQQQISAMMILGKSLDEINQPRTALGIYSRLLEAHPNSPETGLIIMAMADIGLNNPGIKYPLASKGAEFVLDPVFGYDTALKSTLPSAAAEYANYQKGQALLKTGQYTEACRVMSDMLKEFPGTSYRQKIVQGLNSGTLGQITQYQQSGDHLSAVNVFLQAKKADAISGEDTSILLKASISLAYLGLYNEAVNLVTPLKKSAGPKLLPEVENTLAEIEKIRPSNVPSRPREIEKWELFEAGRAYLADNNLSSAEETLNNLKSGDNDESFWAKVSEYAMTEGKWNQKYTHQHQEEQAENPVP
ncbi:MAG: tetratricopeptide repeat protein [Syntrophaceae bacterium]|nr:tetratricopeptide repeat protein [Syntrophaceae bacterium]